MTTRPSWGGVSGNTAERVPNSKLNQMIAYGEEFAELASHFALNPDTTSAGTRTIGIKGGILPNGIWRDAQTIVVPVSSEKYVQLDATTGDAELVDSEFTDGKVWLFYAETDGASLTNLNEVDGAARFDRRSWTHGGSGGGTGGSQILTDSGAPDDADGNDGDIYINTDNGALYQKASGAWALEGNLTGPQGAPGGTLNPRGDWATATAYASLDSVRRAGASYFCYVGHTSDSAKAPGTGADWEDYWALFAEDGEDGAAGAAGTNGTNGATWTTGSGVPSGGNNGDLYFRTSNSDVHQKSGGVWGVIGNIKGATGATGPAGTYTPPAPVVVTESSGTFTPNLASGDHFQMALVGDATMNEPTGTSVDGKVCLFDFHFSSGTDEITLPASFIWPDGVTPNLSPGANKRLIIPAMYDNTTFGGTVSYGAAKWICAEPMIISR